MPIRLLSRAIVLESEFKNPLPTDSAAHPTARFSRYISPAPMIPFEYYLSLGNVCFHMLLGIVFSCILFIANITMT